MPASRYTAEQKSEALDMSRSLGDAEAGRRTGIPSATISSWRRREGILTGHVVPPGLAYAHEVAQVSAETRRLELADKMAGRANAILERMDEVLAKSCEAEVVTAADVKHLASAVAVLVEKVQLLTGEATSRTDDLAGMDLEAELRTWQAGQAEQAAMTKAREAL